MWFMDGILPVCKPVGISSYDVIRVFKQNNPPPPGQKRWKIGHGGTLDPFAEGVLLLLLGKATKMMNELQSLPKTYVATAILGASSDTLDCTGVVTTQTSEIDSKQIDRLDQILPKFLGEIEQKVPDFSAAKVNGTPRYLLAREGKVMETKIKKVFVHKLKIEEVAWPNVVLLATVSSGTYIRQLSYDIFALLGIESHLSKLVRTKIGQYEVGACATIEEVENGAWRLRMLSRGE